MRSMLFFALIVVLSAPGSAAAASSVPITLDVRNFASSGSDGYTNTTASNGKTYSYKYSGGTGKGGDATFTRSDGHKVTVVLHLQSDSRYSIDSVAFPVDPNNQLSRKNAAPTTATIQDENTVVQTATYKVTVKDSTANATLPCDPQIINK